jgi:drug/metabolite transporter (DMT)-like permease
MAWIFLSLGAATLWALVNLGDKYVVGQRITNPRVYTIVGFLAGTLGLVILPFVHFYVPSFYVLFWLLIANLGFFIGTFFYLKSMSGEEVSRLMVIFNSLSIFTLLFGWLFIGDKLSTTQLLAFALLLGGAIISSLHVKQNNKIKFSTVFVWAILSCICYATYDVVVRYLVANNFIDYSLVFVYLTFFISGLSLLMFLSKKFCLAWKENLRGVFTWKLILIIIGIMVASRFGTFIHGKALVSGPVSLVVVIEESYQSILVFILAGLISWLAPKYLKEEWDRKNLLLKLAALILMVAGIVVLNVK